MAVTTEKSTEVTNSTATPIVLNAVDVWHGRVRDFIFNFTQGAAAGDANSTMDLVEVPPGSRILSGLSVIKHSAFGTARTLDVGFTAYTDGLNAAVAAVVDKFLDGLDVALVGQPFMGTGTNAALIHKFTEEVKEGKILIQAKVLVDTIPAAATLEGWMAVIED